MIVYGHTHKAFKESRRISLRARARHFYAGVKKDYRGETSLWDQTWDGTRGITVATPEPGRRLRARPPQQKPTDAASGPGGRWSVLGGVYIPSLTSGAVRFPDSAHPFRFIGPRVSFCIKVGPCQLSPRSRWRSACEIEETREHARAAAGTGAPNRCVAKLSTPQHQVKTRFFARTFKIAFSSPRLPPIGDTSRERRSRREPERKMPFWHALNAFS